MGTFRRTWLDPGIRGIIYREGHHRGARVSGSPSDDCGLAWVFQGASAAEASTRSSPASSLLTLLSPFLTVCCSKSDPSQKQLDTAFLL